MRYDAHGEPIIEQQTCIECGAPVNDEGEFEDSLVPVEHDCSIYGRYHHLTEFVPHGYTCGICSWGRSDQPRTAEEYDRHMILEHIDRCNKETGYHSNPHRGCILR